MEIVRDGAKDPTEGAKKEVAKITDKTLTEVKIADTDKADEKKVTAVAVIAAQKLVGADYKVTAKANGTIAKDKLTITFVVTGKDAANKAETSELTLNITPEVVADPTEGAKKEVAKITDKTLTEVKIADTDKADEKKVTAVAVIAAQKLVGADYKVTAKANGTIAKDKLTITFVVTGKDTANKAETSELTLNITSL